MIRALCVVFGCLFIGKLFISITGLNLPASIIGLILLFILLVNSWVKEEWFKSLSDFLLQNLMLLLIPVCVSLINYLDILANDFWSILLSTIISSILVLIVSGKIHEVLRKWL